MNCASTAPSNKSTTKTPCKTSEDRKSAVDSCNKSTCASHLLRKRCCLWCVACFCCCCCYHCPPQNHRRSRHLLALPSAPLWSSGRRAKPPLHAKPFLKRFLDQSPQVVEIMLERANAIIVVAANLGVFPTDDHREVVMYDRLSLASNCTIATSSFAKAMSTQGGKYFPAPLPVPTPAGDFSFPTTHTVLSSLSRYLVTFQSFVFVLMALLMHPQRRNHSWAITCCNA